MYIGSLGENKAKVVRRLIALNSYSESEWFNSLSLSKSSIKSTHIWVCDVAVHHMGCDRDNVMNLE